MSSTDATIDERPSARSGREPTNRFEALAALLADCPADERAGSTQRLVPDRLCRKIEAALDAASEFDKETTDILGAPSSGAFPQAARTDRPVRPSGKRSLAVLAVVLVLVLVAIFVRVFGR